MPPLSTLSRRFFRLFRWYSRGLLARRFHAVRISRTGLAPRLPRRPTIVVLNHPSWWDPLVGLIATELFAPWRTHFAPIEARGLAQYPFLSRLGFFGIETGSARGGLVFLRTSRALMSVPEATLWITAQGAFVDARMRPVILKQGVAVLAHHLLDAVILPLALEYPFWNDRCPEALLRFGAPIIVGSGRDHSPADWTERIARELEFTQDALAQESLLRDPALFETLLG